MDKFQIKNLKSITDTGPIEIKPITVFVGGNSSGKSSLIRVFPLFKQSSESKTLGTVLWSGKYVDYGSFIESLNVNATEKDQAEISFSFHFKISVPPSRRNSFLPDGTDVKVTIKVQGDEYSKNSYSDLSYEMHGNKIAMRVGSDLKLLAASINGTDYTRQVSENYGVYKVYSIIPLLFPIKGELTSNITPTSNLFKEIKRHVHHRTSDKKIAIISRGIRFGEDEQIIKTLSSKAIVGDFAATKIAKWSSTHVDFQRLKDQIIFSNLEFLVDQLADTMQDTFAASRYITPLRAAADRYYRIQNTSIEELDPNGSNLAMFLHAKTKTEIGEINNWLQSEIGFQIEINTSHGHASIFIIDENNIKSNIADTGFGFSQVLPILIQVWQLAKKKIRRYAAINIATIIVIEQPELHLHPRMQSRVGDAFCKAVKLAKANGINLKIIIETHSKEVIQSIGKCIENEILTKNDVAVYIVEKNAEKNITHSYFDEGGYLTHWPYGFFDGE